MVFFTLRRLLAHAALAAQAAFAKKTADKQVDEMSEAEAKQMLKEMLRKRGRDDEAGPSAAEAGPSAAAAVQSLIQISQTTTPEPIANAPEIV